MSNLVIGVIGHVDHGKTALVRALTGTDTDRLADEQRRGISIALGFAHLADGTETQVDLIDMPGHEKFVRTMIGGAAGIDAVLLVVSAIEGIKPQTVEHVEIASLLGIRRAVVAVSMGDLVAAGPAQAVGANAAAFVREAGVEPICSLVTSATTGQGIIPLRAALVELARSRPSPDEGGRAWLPIDRAFAITGHGPVVTGTLRGAAIAAGDTLELLPARRSVRARQVQVHGDVFARAAPGQRIAVNLRGVERGELERGMALAEPGAVPLSDWITVAVRALAGAPTIKNGARLRVLIGTSEVDARLRLLDRDTIEPGDSGFAQLHLAEPVATPVGEHAILRLPAPINTVGGGKVLEVATRRQKRFVAERLDRLATLRDLPPCDIVTAEVQHAGPLGTTLDHLSRVSGLAPWKIAERLSAMPVDVTRAGLVAPRAELERLAAALPSLLATASEGLSQTALRAKLGSAGEYMIGETLERLVANGRVVRRGSRYALPRPDHERARRRDAAALDDRIAGSLRAAGLTPPLPKEIVIDGQSREAVERLLRTGMLIRAVDRPKAKELLFHRDAIAEARRRLEPLLAPEPGLLVTEIAAALGISRKFVMPLLDHLDTTRFTRRDGDRRRLHPSHSASREDENDQAAQEHV